MDLKKVNLNLLVYFEILFTELSVSKAADKCYLSQAAMSGILKRLREIFDDPLFIRESHGLQPTPKAIVLYSKVKTCLTYAEEVFAHHEFDPSTEIATFNCVFGSHGELLILSKLTAYLEQYAPHIKLKTAWITGHLNLDETLASTVDLVIGADFLPHGNSIIKEFLLEEEMACAMRKSHPFASKKLTPELFMEAGHVEIQFIENALVQLGINIGSKRKIKITVPNLISALEVIRGTDNLAIVPSSLACLLNEKQDFEIKPLPFPKKSFSINLFYHKRFTNHKPLQWLMSIIKEFCI